VCVWPLLLRTKREEKKTCSQGKMDVLLKTSLLRGTLLEE
jgi:hypothetical protein